MAKAIKICNYIDTGYTMLDKEKIKAFVQDVLGCGCAEEVFTHIEAGPDIVEDIGCTRINVGGRLLVYVFYGPGPAFVEDKLVPALRDGMRERDAFGYNRFRLVLASGDRALKAAAEKMFSGSGFADDRAHLHVVPPGAVAFLRR